MHRHSRLALLAGAFAAATLAPAGSTFAQRLEELDESTRAALAVGVAGAFIETHDDPDKAISDGPNMVPLGAMRGLLEQLSRFDALAKELPLPRF